MSDWGTYYHLGEMALDRGDLGEACRAFEAASAAAREQAGVAELIRCLNPWAGALGACGLWEQAEKVATQVLELVCKVRGSRHPEAAVARANLAQYCKGLGQIDRAETLLRESLLDLEAGPDYRVARENLAQFLVSEGRLEEGLGEWKAVAAESDSGSEGQARAWLTVAHLCDALHHPEAADEARSASLSILGERWGDSLGLAQVLEGSAQSLLAHGRPAQAAELLRQGLAILEHLLPVHDPRRHVLQEMLFRALLESGPWEEALSVGSGLAQRLLECYGPANPKREQVLTDLGLAHFMRQDYGNAGQLFQQALEISDSTVDAPLSARVRSRYNLASALQGQARWVEAEGLYREALELGEPLGRDHQLIERVEFNLAELLRQASEDQQEAAGNGQKRRCGGAS